MVSFSISMRLGRFVSIIGSVVDFFAKRGSVRLPPP